MARKRMINPLIWTSEQFGKLTNDERMLFIGIISNADDEGKLRGSPLSLKAAIFPFDSFSPETVREWRDKLQEVKLIVIYEIESIEYIHIPKFLIHQYIQHSTKSILPNPPDNLFCEKYDTDTVSIPYEYDTDTEQVSKVSKSIKGLIRKDQITTSDARGEILEERIPNPDPRVEKIINLWQKETCGMPLFSSGKQEEGMKTLKYHLDKIGVDPIIAKMEEKFASEPEGKIRSMNFIFTCLKDKPKRNRASPDRTLETIDELIAEEEEKQNAKNRCT